MRLKDYAQHEHMFFKLVDTKDKLLMYYTDTGATKKSVGARRWTNNELEWFDADTEIIPIALPSARPFAPADSWWACHDRTAQETQDVCRNYIRKAQAYMDAQARLLKEQTETLTDQEALSAPTS